MLCMKLEIGFSNIDYLTISNGMQMHLSYEYARNTYSIVCLHDIYIYIYMRKQFKVYINPAPCWRRRVDRRSVPSKQFNIPTRRSAVLVTYGKKVLAVDEGIAHAHKMIVIVRSIIFLFVYETGSHVEVQHHGRLMLQYQKLAIISARRVQTTSDTKMTSTEN